MEATIKAQKIETGKVAGAVKQRAKASPEVKQAFDSTRVRLAQLLDKKPRLGKGLDAVPAYARAVTQWSALRRPSCWLVIPHGTLSV
jgi:hypothetical protein